MSDSRRGFGLDIGYIDHFTTQLVITLNYSAITDFHILQITSVYAKFFSAYSVVTTICLVTASNNGYSSASGSSPLRLEDHFQLPLLQLTNSQAGGHTNLLVFSLQADFRLPT
jgi:hypothetical protein